jgi:hypothetical protein
VDHIYRTTDEVDFFDLCMVAGRFLACYISWWTYIRKEPQGLKGEKKGYDLPYSDNAFPTKKP